MTEATVDAHLESILRLAFVAEFRDADTGHHLRRISLLSRLLAERLGWSNTQADSLEKAAGMHDIGKVAIPDQILLKPAALTTEERAIMQQHTALGARLLADGETEVLRFGQAICHSHHERWDGRGYPEGLSGEDIPLEARIVAVADVYDALVTRRVYKPAATHEVAMETLRAESGKHFDPQVIDAFVAAEDQVLAIYEQYNDEDEVDGWVV